MKVLAKSLWALRQSYNLNFNDISLNFSSLRLSVTLNAITLNTTA